MIVHGWQIHVGLHRELGRLYPAVGLVVHNVGGPHRRPIRPVGGGKVKLGLAGAGQLHGSKGARHYGGQLHFAVGFGWPVATPSRVAQFVPILISISLLTFGNDSKGRSQDFLWGTYTVKKGLMKSFFTHFLDRPICTEKKRKTSNFIEHFL